MLPSKTLAALSVVLAGGVLMSAVPADAACKRMGFSVNDYGKDGPTKDAKALLDKHIAKKMAEQGIKKFTTGKKDVKCELFLNFIVFDEHTCTAEATVCWDGSALPKSQQIDAKADGTATPEAAKSGTAATPETSAPAAKSEAAKTESKPEQKPAEAAAPDAKPESKASEAKPETKSTDAAPAETPSTETKATDAKPADAKPVDEKAADAKPVATSPVTTGTINDVAPVAKDAAAAPEAPKKSAKPAAAAGYPVPQPPAPGQ
jgi:hypothetical protein